MIKESVTSEYLFENEFCFVTTSGDLIQKDNRFFKGRVLCNLEEEQIEDQVKKYTETFENLRDEITLALDTIDEDDPTDEKSGQLDLLVEKLKSADAVGDFESVLAQIESIRGNPDSENETVEGEKDSGTDTAEAVVESGKSSAPDKSDQNESVELSSDDNENASDDKEKNDSESGPVNTEIVSEAEEPKEDVSTASADETYPEALQPYVELVVKAEEVAKSTDWQYGKLELDNLSHKWTELPHPDEEYEEQYDTLNNRFQSAGEAFQQKKTEHYAQVKQKKQKNADRKKDLLERFEKIIAEKKWHAVGEVKGIEKRWEKIHLLSGAEADELEQKYKRLSDIFEENRVEYLVKRKQKEEDNLNLKLLILDKIDLLVENIGSAATDWEKVDADYNEYLKEWKKIGRVPKNKSGEVWQRYRSIRSRYIEKKLENNEEYRQKIESNIKKKEELCRQAETLIDEEDLANASKEINKLHKKWKDTGPLPKEKSDELWARFKEASDKFNKKKSENIELLREQEKDNYLAKQELCIKAEQIKDTDDWKTGTKKMQDLMETWKKIGPVPRRKTHKIWKRFKKAMDEFYDRKRAHFKVVRDEQKENLKKKREIINKIIEIGKLEDAREAVNLTKPLQTEFNKIGFVPIKNKNKIYKQFREACDIVYQRSRAERIGGSYVPSAGKLDNESLLLLKRKHGELSRLKKECDELKDTILKYSDTKTFIKPNKKGNQLRDEIQAKIDKASQDLDEKLNRLDDVRQEIDDIKAQAQEE